MLDSRVRENDNYGKTKNRSKASSLKFAFDRFFVTGALLPKPFVFLNLQYLYKPR